MFKKGAKKMDTPKSLVIETKNLSKTYREVHALHDLNLAVKEHSIFGFLGPNGAGKTTAIKLLLGLARPTSGYVHIFGQDIQRESIPIRKRIGYLAQDPRFYEYMTARETLRFTIGCFFSGPKATIEDRIKETLELGIAQAQVNYPDLLILDEPAAALDPMGRRDVLEVMERLRKYTTIFYSTHILEDVQRVSDAVAILNKGKLVAQASIEELLAGSGGAIYQLKLATGAESARKILQAQPWVTRLAESRTNGTLSLSISVSDEGAAKDQLLRLALSDPAVTVVEYGRKTYNLEDIFVNLVEGEQNGR
jgi:ABC-2 type transport system ATP-binding protein